MPKKEEVNRFSSEIFETSKKLKCGLVEAIFHHCERFSIESEVASSLISKELRTKLNKEAKALHLLKRPRRRKRKIVIDPDKRI